MSEEIFVLGNDKVSFEEFNTCVRETVDFIDNNHKGLRNSSNPALSLFTELSSHSFVTNIPTGKRKKILQLMLLQEIWARTGTNQKDFYLSLFLLHKMGIFDIKSFCPELHQVFSSEKLNMLESKDIENKCYNIAEQIMSKLPTNLPMYLSSNSLLTKLLNPTTLKYPKFVGNEKQIQNQKKLLVLLKQSRFLTDFHPKKILGRGGFGVVLEAQNKTDEITYAVKLIRFKDFSVPSQRFQRVFREVTTLAKLDHVNIARYFSAWLEITEDDHHTMLNQLDDPINPKLGRSNISPGLSSNSRNPTYLSLNSTEISSQSISQSGNLSFSQDSSVYYAYNDDTISDISQLIPVTDDDSMASIKDVTENQEDQEEDEEEDDEEDDGIIIEGSGTIDLGFHGTFKATPSLTTPLTSKSIPPRLTRWNSSKSLMKSQILVPTPIKDIQQTSKTIQRRNMRKSMANMNEIVCYKTRSVNTKNYTKIQTQKIDYTLFIQMQLYSTTTLKQFLHNPERVISKNENLKIFKQIVEGLKHVHTNGLLHRDLKPANIFLSEDGTVKIGDFGLSKEFNSLLHNELANSADYFGYNNAAANGDSTRSVGTPGYVAPELFTAGNSFGPTMDIYSLGIILLELFTKTLTKHERGRNLMDLRNRILPEPINSEFPDIGELILKMTDPEPLNRPSLEDIRNRIELSLDAPIELLHKVLEQETQIEAQSKLIAQLMAQNNKLVLENEELKRELGRKE